MSVNTQVIEEESGSAGSEGAASSGGAAGGTAAAGGATGRRLKKKGKRTITDVIVHVYASFNNTIITVTDNKGNTLSWATAGGSGFRGSRKSTPFAGQVAAAKAIQKAKELYGVETAEIRIDGPGPARDAAARAVRDSVFITAIYDITATPFNGCRAEKPRRV